MKKSGFLVTQPVSRVTSKKELMSATSDHRLCPRAKATHVGILVDGARNETRNVVASAEDLGEGVAEGWRSLNSGEVEHADIVAVRETKDVLDLARGQGLGHKHDVFVECATACKR